jgi:hypothetical protein
MITGDLVMWWPSPEEVGTEDLDIGLIGIVVAIEKVVATWIGTYVVLWSDGTTGRGLHPDHLMRIDYERG